MKQVILVPMWLGMSAGKAISQCCHVVAANEAIHQTNAVIMARIVLKVRTPEELIGVLGRALKNKRLHVSMFADSGPTTEGTDEKITAIAITGFSDELAPVTSGLELY